MPGLLEEMSVTYSVVKSRQGGEPDPSRGPPKPGDELLLGRGPTAAGAMMATVGSNHQRLSDPASEQPQQLHRGRGDPMAGFQATCLRPIRGIWERSGPHKGKISITSICIGGFNPPVHLGHSSTASWMTRIIQAGRRMRRFFPSRNGE
ncbi:hypothetical protein LguiB_028425 [Lonicera macranthoides]